MSWEDQYTKVRLPKELVARIDKLRGLAPREAYIRLLVLAAVVQEEKSRKKGKHRVGG